MFKTILYSFEPGEIPASFNSPVIEIRSICSMDLPKDLDALKGNTPEAHTVEARGARALRRIEANEFTAAEIETLRELCAFITAKRQGEIAELRVEREERARDEMNRKAYDGLINALEDAVGRLKRQTDYVTGEFERLIAEAVPHPRRP